MATLKQSTTYTRMFLLVDSTDHTTGKTGVTPTVTLSKAGGSFGAAGGTVSEVASGWYKVALTTTDTNTLGDLAYHITGTGCDATDFVDQVAVRGIDDLAFPATSGRSMVVDASGLVDANTVKVGPTGSGTAQTARDVGASVLLSSGTGTGQLDFTSGVVKANLAQILGTALTETSGQIAAAFKKFFDKATPTGTINSIPDAVAGATGGLFIAGTNAATTVNITGNLSGSVGSVTGAVGSVTGSVGSIATGGIAAASFAAGAIDAAAIATDAIGSAELAASAVTEIQSGLSTHTAADVWAVATRLLTAGTNIVLAKGTGVTGFNDLDAAGVRTAVGLASANLDTQLTTIDDFLDTEVAAIKAKTDNLPASPAAVGSAMTLASGAITAAVIATDAIDADAFATDAVTEIQSGLSTLTAAGIRTAIGLASANLDTQLTTIDDFLDTEIAAIKAKTDNLPASPANEATLTTIAGYLDTEVAAIKAKTDLIPASPSAVGDIPTAIQNADALLDRTAGVETSRTVRQALRLMLAALGGKLSGAATTTVTIRDTNDSKDRIIATVDSDGNRSAVTYDAS